MSARDELAALLSDSLMDVTAMGNWGWQHGADVLALIDAAQRYNDPFPDEADREELQMAVARLTESRDSEYDASAAERRLRASVERISQGRGLNYDQLRGDDA